MAARIAVAAAAMAAPMGTSTPAAAAGGEATRAAAAKRAGSKAANPLVSAAGSGALSPPPMIDRNRLTKRETMRCRKLRTAPITVRAILVRALSGVRITSTTTVRTRSSIEPSRLINEPTPAIIRVATVATLPISRPTAPVTRPTTFCTT